MKKFLAALLALLLCFNVAYADGIYGGSSSTIITNKSALVAGGTTPIVFAQVGDSILDQGQINNSSTRAYTANGILTWVRILTGERINFLLENNYAVSGSYCAGNPGQIESQMIAVAALSNITDVLYHGCTNDLQAGTTVANMQASEKRGISALLAAGKRVWVLPMMPRSLFMTAQLYQRQQEMNDWRREYCARSRSELRTAYGWPETGRLVYVDVMPSMVDQLTGLPLTGINQGDLVHLTAKAAKIPGTFIANIINQEVPPSNNSPTSFYNYYSSENPSGNLFISGVSVSTATVSAGGSGHVVGDVISLANGVTLRVLTVSTGAVATVQVVNPGYASAAPGNPQAQTGTTGGGTGSSFNLTWVPHNLGLLTGTGGTKSTLNGITPTGSLADGMRAYRALGASSTTTFVLGKENPRTDGLTGERQTAEITLGGTGGLSQEIYQIFPSTFITNANISAGDKVRLFCKVEITGSPVNLIGVSWSVSESGPATPMTVSDLRQSTTVFPNEAGVYYFESPVMTVQSGVTSFFHYFNIYMDASTNTGSSGVIKWSDPEMVKVTTP